MCDRKRVVVVAPVVLGALFGLFVSGCNGNNNAEDDAESFDLSSVPVPPADGPKLASVDKSTPIYERPFPDAPIVGTMRAGAVVGRAEEPVSRSRCSGGWYPIHPRGFVCVGHEATTNLAHPTLAVMKTLPARDAPLPYQYYSTTKATSLYEWDRAKGAAVREVGKLRRRSRIAVVGSWTAQIPQGGTANLAMLPDSKFVDAAHLEESNIPTFKGTAIDDTIKLPIAFVVKQGVRAWMVDGKNSVRGESLDPQTMIPLTGRFRTVGDAQYWATQHGSHVRHSDVALVRRRETFPDFVNAEQKWIDISVITGVTVLYEGKKPVYATLCSVGLDRMGDPDTEPTTRMGTFEITAKHLTTSEPGTKPFADNHDVFEVPWVQLLSSGQMLHGAMWHTRFGVEYGPGNVQFSPSDAAHLFAWTSPVVPEGWHSVLQVPGNVSKVIVHIRK